MKKTLLIVASLLMLIAFTPNAKAQEMSTGLDIYSSYVWRGIKFGNGAAFQPSIEFSAGGFALGAWGNYCSSDEEAAEADIYASYGFDLGENASLSLTITDYHFPSPGTEYFDKANHYLEPMIGIGAGPVSFSAAYMFHDGFGKDGDASGDIYLEAVVTAGPVDLTLAGGNGQYSDKSDSAFDICNIGVSTSKEVKITDSFSLPVSGAVILNPSYETFHVVVGISL